MQQVFASQIEQITLQFRDYIFKQYGVSLTLYAIPQSDQTHYLFAAFLEENNPYFQKIMQAAQSFNPDDKTTQTSWEVGMVSQNTTNYYATIFKKFFTKDTFSWKNIYPIKFTLFITLLCFGIYVLEVIGFRGAIMQLFHYPTDAFEQKDWWRYITPALVHLSWWHLGFNLLFWWLFAGLIERQCGTLQLIILFFCSALISAMVENYFSGPDFFGLSGVVYAVLGFVLILNKFFPDRFMLPDGFFTMLIIGIILGFATPIIGIYTGNAAHISGFIIGMLLALTQKRHIKS
ncbi:hypothetical protein A6A19_04100 [Actinobacillus delphinicola]|uniref:rhomboid family intramembrane serine protease n=1 Tax=Actinobacillus delphinicola TaxID=51161 RepID=UPI00244147E9|nr:rhomboid family intramembrane serine protease [Actinobacillus delphinicola]MDG6897195.1 hypothetical protein [Actinobacillus delphinicola]